MMWSYPWLPSCFWIASSVLVQAENATYPPHATDTSGAVESIHWISSTATEKWHEDIVGAIDNTGSTVKADIVVFPSQKLQTVEGFGGAFNELGWEALLALEPSEREKILKDLFSKDQANFSLCRIPIGASDYALSYYSLDDVPEDFTMRNFNIDRDRYILIPYIKAAIEVRPDLAFWASPWTPPAWMKVNQQYTLRAGNVKNQTKRGNEMDPGKNMLNSATAFRMEDEYLKAYALYLSKFVQAYQNEGIKLKEIHVQNEIIYSPQWPSCTWRPEDLAYFIGTYLGPQFKLDHIKTEIWLGTINSGDPDYVRRVLNDGPSKTNIAAQYISGVGFQWAGKSALPAISKEYSALRYMQTESECGNGENSWQSAEHTWSLMNHYFTYGVGAYMYWNMVLDSSGESSWGWPQNMLVSINKQTKEVRYTPDYYLMKHLSHFVLPGASLLQTSGGKDHLAFVNPDESVVLELVNAEGTDQSHNITIGKKTLMIVLKAHSFNTFVFGASSYYESIIACNFMISVVAFSAPPTT